MLQDMFTSELPTEIWISIASRLDAAADWVHLRAVCKQFRTSLPSYHPIWLMLSEDEQEDGTDMRLLFDQDFCSNTPPPPPRGFVVIGEHHIHQLQLPEAHQKRCVGSIDTWLATVDIDGNICMLNAFSRAQISLPHQLTLIQRPTLRDRKRVMNSFVCKVVLSSSPDNKDCVAAAIFNHKNESSRGYLGNVLALAKPGDATWAFAPLHGVEDMVFFGDQIYLVDRFGRLWTYNNNNNQGGRRSLDLITTRGLLTKQTYSQHLWRFYLAKWQGEMLLVVRVWPGPGIQSAAERTDGFRVYKRDFKNNIWVEVSDLGEYCLFLGLNTPAAVCVTNYTAGCLQGNCIYFTANKYEFESEDRNRGYPVVADDIGMYSLQDKKIRAYYQGICSPCCSPPIWVIPTKDLQGCY